VSLLLAAPERASELFFLKHNCIYEEEVQAFSKSSLGLVKDGSNVEEVLGIKYPLKSKHVFFSELV